MRGQPAAALLPGHHKFRAIDLVTIERIRQTMRHAKQCRVIHASASPSDHAKHGIQGPPVRGTLPTGRCRERCRNAEAQLVDVLAPAWWLHRAARTGQIQQERPKEGRFHAAPRAEPPGHVGAKPAAKARPLHRDHAAIERTRRLRTRECACQIGRQRIGGGGADHAEAARSARPGCGDGVRGHAASVDGGRGRNSDEDCRRASLRAVAEVQQQQADVASLHHAIAVQVSCARTAWRARGASIGDPCGFRAFGEPSGRT